MQIAYELAERDFIEAYSAHRNRNGLSKWVRRIFIAIMGVFTMVILFGFLVKPSLQAAKGLLPFFGLMVMWVAALWILPLWNTPRQFRKQPGARGQGRPCSIPRVRTGAGMEGAVILNGKIMCARWKVRTYFLFTRPLLASIFSQTGAGRRTGRSSAGIVG